MEDWDGTEGQVDRRQAKLGGPPWMVVPLWVKSGEVSLGPAREKQPE